MKLGDCDIGDGVHLVLMRDWDKREPIIQAMCSEPVDLQWSDWWNDLHWAEIDRMWNTFGDLRSFVFTMNPYVVDKLEIESAEHARTHILLADESGLRNMSAEEAARVWRAYSMGVQRLSEILRTEGLW